MELLEIFNSLPAAASPGSYTAAAEQGAGYRVARSSDGYPSLILRFDGVSPEPVRRRLSNLEYEPPGPIEILGEKGLEPSLALLVCRSRSYEIVALFFRISKDVLLTAESLAHESSFSRALDGVVQLFHALGHPGKSSLIGAWAELAMILWSQDPQICVTSWHSCASDTHDFQASPHRLEVKATTTGLREHSVGLEQLNVLPDGVTMIASLMLEEDDSGSSVRDLVNGIRNRLSGNAEMLRRLETIVAKGLGQAWEESDEYRYSLARARSSLRLFRAQDVPWVHEPLPPEVKRVRFTVDLSGIRPVDLGAVRTDGWFAHVLPIAK